jgi:hypothetical protein
VKPIIEKKLMRDGTLDGNNQGQEGRILHASISNYQNNLMRGPDYGPMIPVAEGMRS